MEAINKTKKELIRQAKQEAADLLQQSNSLIENTIRKIKESKAEKETTREARQELEAFKQHLTPTTSKKTKPKKEPATQPLQVGDSVSIKGKSMVGTILELQSKNVLVAIGLLKTTVSLDKIEKVSHNQLKKQGLAKPTASADSESVRHAKLHFKHDIDLRGMRAEEALQAVMYFLDDAIMVGAGTIRILHGTGTGALRQVVRQYLSTAPGVRHFRDEHVQFGGAGITVVELE